MGNGERGLSVRHGTWRIAIVLVVATLIGLVPTGAQAAPGDNIHARLSAATFAPVQNVQQPSLPAVGLARTTTGDGYWLVHADGAVQAFGSAVWYGNAYYYGPLSESFVDIAARPAGGYWILSGRGRVVGLGPAPQEFPFYDYSMKDPAVAIAASTVSSGGWVLTESGRVFSFGGAGFAGSPSNEPKRFVDIAATADGYRIAAADGTVYRYRLGQAPEVEAVSVTGNVAAIAGSGDAFWLVTEGGSIHGVGGAATDSPVATTENDHVVSAEATSDSAGLWVATEGPSSTAGHISGQVVRESAGTPLDRICVRAFYGDTLQAIAGTRTDADGSYRLGPLPSANYRVVAEDCGHGLYLGEWNEDAEVVELATPITVGTSTATVDFDLVEGSFLDGVVTSEDGELPGICVGVHDTAATPRAASTSMTSVSGSYHVMVRTGTYEVQFADCTNGEYLGEWYDDKQYRANATPVSIGAETTTDLAPALLGRAGMITGVVEDVDRNPVTNACVSLENDEGVAAQTRRTDVSGNYRLTALRSGEYKVRFHNCQFVNERFRSPADGNWAEEWSGDSPTREGATPVVVGEGTTTTQNAVLRAGGVATGVVTDPSGAPLPGACVDLFDGTTALGSTQTSSTGYYRLGQLGDRPYRVRFSDCGMRGLASEWWNNAPTSETAADVQVPPASTADGFNAQLTAGGAITGVVKDAAGNGLGGVCVGVHEPNGTLAGFGYTDWGFGGGVVGTYRIDRLAGAGYTVSFNDCAPWMSRDLAQSWYAGSGAGVSMRADAAPVAIAPPATTTGINSTMVKAGVIVGVVTNSAGRGLAGVCVRTQYGSEYATGITSVTGLYQVRGLPAGSYNIEFVDCHDDDGYLDEWWNNAPDLASATSIPVGIGSDIRDIDAELARRGVVTNVEAGGTVATEPPTASDPIQVALTSPAGGEVTIEEGVDAAPPVNYEFLSTPIAIEAPGGSVDDPLEISFTVLDSALNGMPASSVQVFRDGSPVGPCVHAAGDPISPDPCALDPVEGSLDGAGTWTFTVLSSHASLWFVALPSPTFVGGIEAPPALNGVRPGSVVPIRFSLGADLGPNMFSGAESRTVPCGSGPSEAVADTLKRGTTGVSYDSSTATYTYAWQTDRRWRKTCRELTVSLTNGDELTALFDFR